MTVYFGIRSDRRDWGETVDIEFWPDHNEKTAIHYYGTAVAVS